MMCNILMDKSKMSERVRDRQTDRDRQRHRERHTQGDYPGFNH